MGGKLGKNSHLGGAKSKTNVMMQDGYLQDVIARRYSAARVGPTEYAYESAQTAYTA